MAAIAEKSTGWTLAMAAKTWGLGAGTVGGCWSEATPPLLSVVSVSGGRVGSGAAKPSSSQSSATG
jgi:hypothetical protein